MYRLVPPPKPELFFLLSPPLPQLVSTLRLGLRAELLMVMKPPVFSGVLAAWALPSREESALVIT